MPSCKDIQVTFHAKKPEPSVFSALITRAVQDAERTNPAMGRLLRSVVAEYADRMRKLNS